MVSGSFCPGAVFGAFFGNAGVEPSPPLLETEVQSAPHEEDPDESGSPSARAESDKTIKEAAKMKACSFTPIYRLLASFTLVQSSHFKRFLMVRRRSGLIF